MTALQSVTLSPLRRAFLLGIPQNVPASVKFPAAVYFVMGMGGAGITLFNVVHGQWILDPKIIGFPIGIGLLRLKSGWDRVAVIASCLQAAVIAWLFAMLATGHLSSTLEYLPGSLAPFLYAVGCICLLYGIAMILIVRILTLPQVRLRFQDSPTNDRAKAIRAAAFLLVLLGISRLTGGNQTNFGPINWSGSWSTSDLPARHHAIEAATSPLSGTATFANPILIEYRMGATVPERSAADERSRQEAGTIPSDYEQLVCEFDVGFREIGNRSTSCNYRFIRLSGILIDDSLSKSANRFIVSIERPNLSGNYWMPLFKWGKAKCRATIQGAGVFQHSINVENSFDFNFSTVGPRTSDSLRRLVLTRVMNASRDAIRSRISEEHNQKVEMGMGDNASVDSSGWKYSLSDLAILERASRTTTSRFGMQILFRHYGRLGSEYESQEFYADAAQAYQECAFMFDRERAANLEDEIGNFAPDFHYIADVYAHRGHCLMELNVRKEAVADYRRAVELYERAIISGSGKEAEQVMHDTFSSLAVIYSTGDPLVRDGVKAIKAGKAACGYSRWRDPNDIRILAGAYTEAGKFREALKFYVMASEIQGLF